MKWDMGWMNDTLRFMRRDPIHRQWHLNDLTFRGVYAFTENFMLPLSHDEVVHGKKSLLDQMAGDEWQKFANLRLLYGLQFATAGKKLHFMGSEIAQWNEWNHDGELDWVLRTFEPHEGIRRLVCDLNRIYRDESALHSSDTHSDGFQWIVGDDQTNCVIAFLRRTLDASEQLLVVANLTPAPRGEYRIGVPKQGFYQEVLNTDAEWYGGSGQGNIGGVQSSTVASHGYEQSVRIHLPPLSVTIMRCVEEPPNVIKDAATKDATTKDATTKDAATRDAATKDAATKDATTKDAATKGGVI